MTQVLDEERVERAADAMRKRRAELQHAPLDRIYSELFAAAISAYLGETHVVVARKLLETALSDLFGNSQPWITEGIESALSPPHPST